MDERQHYECQKWMTTALKESPQVVFMLERLERAGCKFNIQHFKSIPFASIHTGGFVPTHGIFAVENKITSYQHMEDTLTHQMIHAFDHCTTKINWKSQDHYACSEIRATTLSGECKFDREFMRGNFGLGKHHQKCVKRKVIEKMLLISDRLESGNIQDSVDAVFDVCFNDTAPFNEIY